MRKRIALAILILLSATPTLPSCGDSPSDPCCKVCTTGKPCGDTCISASATCSVGPGCACAG